MEWSRRARGRRRTGFCTLLAVLAGLTSVPLGGSAALAAPLGLGNIQLALAPVASGLTSPVALARRPGDPRLYVAQQTGAIRLIETAIGTVAPTPVLSLTVGCCGERGLLGLAFTADGSKLYVDYTDSSGTIHIVEYAMAADTAITATARELLAIPHPLGNHNGGQLAMGPDNDLYIGVGDGGGSGDPNNNGQNLNTLLGKILRIDPAPSGGLEYTIPPDNPFVGQPNTRAEIWMYGLRNPWKFTFDRDTGDLWIGDVGQNLYEEVDYAPAGQQGTNWGWSLREGFSAFKGAQPPDGKDPLVAPSHAEGYCALIGGYVYRGQEIPGLNGAYLFGDLCRTRLIGLAQDGGAVTDQRDLGIDLSQLSTFGEGNDGELYVATLSGTVAKLIAVTPSVSVGDATIVEGDAGTAMASVPVSMSTPATAPVTAQWSTANGTARAPGDFTASSGTVTFAPGETSQSVLVPVAGDEVDEPVEKFSVRLSGLSGATMADSSAIVNVLDDDAPISVSVSDAVAVEGNSGSVPASFTVQLSRPVPAGTSVSVTVSTSGGTATAGSDYSAAASTVITFAVGEQTKPVSVSVIGDTAIEKNEIFKLSAKSPVGAVIADGMGTATIVNDDGTPSAVPKPSVSVSDATIVEGDVGSALVSVPVSLSSPAAAPVTAQWSTANGTAKAPGDFTASSGTVTFAPGETSQSVLVPVAGDEVSEVVEKFTIKLSAPSGASLADSRASVNVQDNDAPISVRISESAAGEGDSGSVRASFTVSLSRPVPVGATVSVTLSTSGGTATAASDYTAVTSTVLTFAAGQQTRSVPVNVRGDTAVENNETFKLNLKSPAGAVFADMTGTGSIIDDD
ncbi:MAG: PQQ-dependent sugar dehydrogenase [Actinobacteria bacterium]|nr:PQQ-dependent sugar dehydrogenase [Actinomycetota bacterium]